jgi:hypothetical protein
VSVDVYNLAGTLLYHTSLSLNSFEIKGIALETLTEVKGRQGLMTVILEENKRLAAFLLQRRASQPDYTTGMIALSPSLFVSRLAIAARPLKATDSRWPRPPHLGLSRGCQRSSSIGASSTSP